MNKSYIPRKWEYIAERLEEINAPKKVINAAIELDDIMVGLGLGDNTSYWERHYTEFCGKKELNTLISSRQTCTACVDAKNKCEDCKLGILRYCTPRSKYPDDYFAIVRGWSFQNLI